MECKCESCTRKDCNERTKQDDLRIVIQCDDFIQKNMTNGDRVRSMSNEKLANLLGDKCVCPPSGECAETSGNCDSCWLKWLKKPVEDE